MTRHEAIEILARHDLTELDRDARTLLLLDWWSLDADDPEYHLLPGPLKEELAAADDPGDPVAARYEPLIVIALKRRYTGVINSFLENRLAHMGHGGVTVGGDVEEMVACPCCGYLSLHRRGDYEICPVCFWEDDGSNDPAQKSGPNHMTLGEARANFDRMDAVDEAARRHVSSDARVRYAFSGRTPVVGGRR